MSKETLIDNVADTAFWVGYYRAKENERSDALFRDPYAKILVGDKGKLIAESMKQISRYTEWSVVSRTVIIDRFIEKLIKDGVDTIINLGAGLDTRPYRMQLPATLEWIEADYPSMIQYKSAILSSEKPKCKLTRMEIDLTDNAKRKSFLKNIAPNSKKVLIITEGVIPYLSPEQVTDLSNDLIARPSFHYWITEYFHKKVYKYLKQTIRTAQMKNAPFLFYPDDWYGFFKHLGWKELETRFTNEIGVEFNRKPPMPKWAEWMFTFLPKKMRQQAMRMTGYMVFERAN